MAATAEKKSTKLMPFEFHGVSFTRKTEKESIAECIFCGKPNKFYVNRTTGQWSCKVCGKNGNVYTFLEHLHAGLLEGTDDAAYALVSELRHGIPAAAFKTHGVAWIDGTAYLPIRNENGTVVQLRRYDSNSTRYRQWMNTAELPTQLWGMDRLAKNQDETVYICEGEWDGIAFDWLRRKNKEPGVVMAVPGSETFKNDWIEKFRNREVVLLFDNDPAGYDGMQRVARLLRSVVKSLRTIHWPADVEEKFDLNDFISANVKTPAKTWEALQAMLVSDKDPASRKSSKPIKVPKFSQLVREYRKHFHLTESSEDALKVMLGAVFSAAVPGDPVWLFLVGPPGGGKSLMVSTLVYSPTCVFKSKLTPRSLASGYRSGDGGEDPSLLPQLTDKCLVIKDYTTVKSMSMGEQEELYGVLRDAYDGRVEISFGNGVTRKYDHCHFAMVAAVTDIIHGDSRATLGERFLKYELIRQDYDPGNQIRMAIDNMNEAVEGQEKLQELFAAFTEKPLNPDKLPKAPQWVVERVMAVTQIIAYLRAGVDRVGGIVSHRPRPEIGTRLAKQIIKLGRCIAFVLDKPSVDKDVYKLMEQVAFDTAIGWNLDIIRTLIGFYPKYKTMEELIVAAQIPQTSLFRKLGDLMELSAVEVKELDTGERGRKPLAYRVSTSIHKLWTEAKVGESGSTMKKAAIKTALPSKNGSYQRKTYLKKT